MTKRGKGLLAAALFMAVAGAAPAAIRVPVPAMAPHVLPPPASHVQAPAAALVHRAPARAVRKISRTRPVRAAAAHVYYDYYAAREVREDFAARAPRSDYTEADAPTAPAMINGRDFNGGVGYGQNGDMGYQGFYGRYDPYNGNSSMNGGGMAAGAPRFHPRHGGR